MNNVLKLAIKAAIEAGKVVLEIYQSKDIEVKFKDDSSPLTEADMSSHNIIQSYLKDSKIPILSEEGKSIPYEVREKWNTLWIVDPIDGTKEFIKRNGEFTVNIALIENKKPVLGVIFVPVSGELYYATSKHGSYKVAVDLKSFNVDDLLTIGKKLPLKQKESAFTIIASRSHLSAKTEDYINKMRKKHDEVVLISKGSSLKFCVMAEGLADVYPRFAPTMEWDTAAGQAICRYAGCEVVSCKTNESMLYNRKQLLNGDFIVRRI